MLLAPHNFNALIEHIVERSWEKLRSLWNSKEGIGLAIVNFCGISL